LLFVFYIAILSFGIRFYIFFEVTLSAQVGGGPTATHFSCFAKKSKQKKATQASLPFGFPIAQDKNGESQKLAALKHLPLFFPFLSCTIGSATCGKIKVKSNDLELLLEK